MHKAQYCRQGMHAFTDPLCWESTGSLWLTHTQGPILQKAYPCLHWPTVLRIYWQSVVYSHTRPNIAESVSMPLLTHGAENPLAVCGYSHTRPDIAESASMPLLTHCAENPRAVCGLLAHKAQHCRKCIYAFTDPLCWESPGSLWFARTQGPVLQKVYPCLYWPTVLRIHWQSVVYSHTGPNIAESVSMPLLTHGAENPLAVCGLLAHRAQYCRKCIHAFTDPRCWESTGSLWFTRTQGPILQKVYPCLYWPTVLRTHWQSVVYSHTRPNIAESKHCISNSIVTTVSADRTAQSSMHKMSGCQSASSDVVVSLQYFWFTNDSTHYCVLLYFQNIRWFTLVFNVVRIVVPLVFNSTKAICSTLRCCTSAQCNILWCYRICYIKCAT